MLPLTDGAGYKLFSALNVLAYRWRELQIIRCEHVSPPSAVGTSVKESYENTVWIILSH